MKTMFLGIAVGLGLALPAVTTKSPAPVANGPANVRAWGAKGDGKHDDTRAIQGAVNSLPTYGQAPSHGGRVFFPRGAYVITAPIRLGVGIDLEGESQDSARIVNRGQGHALVLTNTGGMSFNCMIERLTITTDGPVRTNGDAIHFSGESCARLVTIEKVNAERHRHGLCFERGLMFAQVRACRMAWNVMDGLHTADGEPVNVLKVSDTYLSDNGRYGMYVGQNSYSMVENNAAEWNRIGYVFNRCNQLTFTANSAEMNSSAAVRMQDGENIAVNQFYDASPLATNSLELIRCSIVAVRNYKQDTIPSGFGLWNVGCDKVTVGNSKLFGQSGQTYFPAGVSFVE